MVWGVLINAIPLLEAQANSEIENIVTTTDELFSAAASEPIATPAAREALRYRSALRWGYEQLEAIHPFTDGNGRTGRIMNALMLCDAGLLHLPLLYLSRYIIESKDEYYRLLRLVTSEGAWEQWVLYIVEGVRAVSVRTCDLIDRIEGVQAQVLDAVRAVVGSANHDLVALFMEHPYARSADVMERCDVSRPTAIKWLRGLAADGVLEEYKVGRQVLFINRPMMRVLTS